MKRIGWIGAGNMGGAILSGVLKQGLLAPQDVIVCAKTEATLNKLSAAHAGITVTTDAMRAADESSLLLLAVKPQVLGEVLKQLHGHLRGKAVLSIAAGWTMEMLQNALAGEGATILRVMPNTPCLVGEAMTAICSETTFSDADVAFAKQIFGAVGRIAVVPEKQFDGVIAVSGSSPAYVYMLIEAMGDAAVREGIPRKQAYEMAAQSVLGSAKMVLETGTHPAALKDAVCSPAGTTIDAVAALEKDGFRAAVLDAMHVCAEKSRSMAK